MLDRDVVAEYKLDHDFLSEIYALPGGREIKKCIQCGTCSSSCPLSYVMDHGPRKMFSLIRAGFRDEVLSSNTIWFCSSVLHLRGEVPERHQDHRRHVRAEEARRQGGENERQEGGRSSKNFARMVNTYGRNHETELMARLHPRGRSFPCAEVRAPRDGSFS
ncbi:MAG: hypothetical protein MZU95_00560 [Desulfomicrobium escambiense]|nr:hypothetical protein [Desulfomicrobium escambiense]